MKKCLSAIMLLICAGTMAFAQLVPGDQTDASAPVNVIPAAYITPEARQYPYIATYYVQPVVTPDGDAVIKFFVTDWNNSRVRLGDDSFRFDAQLRLTSDMENWQVLELKNLGSGDHAFNLGKLPEGDYTFGIRCTDAAGRMSHTVWHEFRSRESAAVPTERAYTMSVADLAEYGIVQERNRYKVIPVEVGDVDGLKPEDLATAVSNAVNAAAGAAAVPADAYQIFAPAQNGKLMHYGWRRSRVVYGASYDKEAVEQAARTTGLGIQRMLNEAAAEGMRRFVFLPGTYRVSATNTIFIPGSMTVDLNGATVKMNEFTGSQACIFSMSSVQEAHLVNGIIEGDYYEHDYANSSHNSEWPMGIRFEGDCRFSSYENVTVRNITGYGGGNGTQPYNHTFPGYVAFNGKNCYTNGAIRLSDGEIVESGPFLFTSAFRDIGAFSNKYISVSKYLGYQGIRTKSWYYTAAFYNADNIFISAEPAFQYRSVMIPNGARYMRITIEEESLDKAESCELTAQLFKLPWNCAYKGIKFERCRAVGLAPAAMRNMLIEDNEFSFSGENLARCAFDAEDGWDLMQDVYIHKNRFHDNPNNELLFCAGHNFIIEDNDCAVYLWERTQSPCIRNNRFTSASFRSGSRNRTMHGRYNGNTYRDRLNLGGQDKDPGWDAVISGNIKSSEPGKRLGLGVGYGGRLRDAVVENAEVSGAHFDGCTFANSRFIMTQVPYTWRGLVLDGCFVQHSNMSNIIDRCVVSNTTFLSFSGGRFAVSDTKFVNTHFDPSYWARPNVFAMTNSSVIHTNVTFLRTPVYAIGDYSFSGCSFDCGTASPVDIYDLRAQNSDSQDARIIFRDCILVSGNTRMVQVSSTQPVVTKKLTLTASGITYADGSQLIKAESVRDQWVVDE